MRVVIVGSGVYGTWSAHHLLASGADVTLVDAYGAGHSRSSSGDESRIVRCGYGADRIYSDLAWRAIPQWQALSERLGGGAALWHGCGMLWLAAGDDRYTAATRDTLRAAGYPVEAFDAAELARRYPDIDPGGIEVALLEPAAGVVLARRAVARLAAELESRGVRRIRGRVEPVDADGALRAGGSLRGVRCAGGSRVEGDAFVFACGAWLPSVLPALLRGRIRPTRQLVVYFGTPAGEDRFGAARLPAWVDFPAGIYGVPEIEGRGVKVGVDEHGPPMDPDRDDRVPDAASLAKARAWLARRVPALAAAPIVETRVCQYENSATGDLLIDRHPHLDNVWIAGGGSGHGFKHGPAVGELVAQLVTGGASTPARFALAAAAGEARRAVY